MMMMMMVPIEVTLFGIVTEVSDEHSLKAESPNDISYKEVEYL